MEHREFPVKPGNYPSEEIADIAFTFFLKKTGKNDYCRPLLSIYIQFSLKTDSPDIIDFLSDESFINFSKGISEKDIAYWESYIDAHPEQRELIETARQECLLLFNILAESDVAAESMRLRRRIEADEPARVVNMEQELSGDSSGYNKWIRLKWAGVAVAILCLAFAGFQFFFHSADSANKTYTTVLGEKKLVSLSDGTIVHLNAGSELKTDHEYGVSNRSVYLRGEAFFDVKRDESKPFIVFTHAMQIKALGTSFDVRAYDNEAITETSLISGLVEVLLKENNNQVVLLHPNHKIAWRHQGANTLISRTDTTSRLVPELKEEQQPEKLLVTDRGEIKEIAWKENRLVFENDSFSDIAVLLQRWFDVKIEFEDIDIASYRFTGDFEKEDLKTILTMLKESKDFNFIINEGGKLVTLSK